MGFITRSNDGPVSLHIMERYQNFGGDSSAVAYEIGWDSIVVAFSDGSCYLYTYQSAGSDYIERMKELAVAGRGLNRFINTYVKYGYAARIR